MRSTVSRPELPPEGECWIAPDAVLIGKVRLKKNASVWFGAVLRGDNDWITVGENSNVQDNQRHPCRSGPARRPSATMSRSATASSFIRATVGDDSLIGMGAILLNRARIGRHCLVGASALVTEGKMFEDGKMILGSPARAMRDLTAEQIEGIGRSAAIYVANARRFAAGLRELLKPSCGTLNKTKPRSFLRGFSLKSSFGLHKFPFAVAALTGSAAGGHIRGRRDTRPG